MRHGSLFSGIGGFDLAADWIGWENVFHCEKEPFCQKVLNYHFPNSILHEDITQTDFTIYRGRIDILTGGFPCQPYSVAGKRLGKDDDRHLWPEMLRSIQEIQPTWIVGENVSGLINWSGGLVFDEVQIDLETEGYQVIPFILPAAGVNAPHKRDRVWFVAYSDGNRKMVQRRNGDSLHEKRNGSKKIQERENVINGINGSINVQPFTNPTIEGREEREQSDRFQDEKKNRKGVDNRLKRHGNDGTIAYADDKRFSKLNTSDKPRETRFIAGGNYKSIPRDWQNFPTQPPLCGGNDGIPAKLDGITFPKWRNESIKAYGNAIVPQVAYQIFKAIEQFEK